MRHGDVLVYIDSATIIDRAIRFVTGSKAVHVAIVQWHGGELVVIEQLAHRKFGWLQAYTDPSVIQIYRPKFVIPDQNEWLFDPGAPYAWILTIDHLINHGIGRLINGWTHRRLLSRWLQHGRLDCGMLVAWALMRWENDIPEPDDFSGSDFDFLGELKK